MDIKEIALKVADSLRNKVDGISHMQSNQGLVRFAEALIESYKAELLKEAGEPVACVDKRDWDWHRVNSPETSLGIWPTSDWKRKLNLPYQVPMFFYTTDQLAAAILKATKPLVEERDRAVKRMESGWIEVCDSGILAFKEMNDELRTQLTAAQEANEHWQRATAENENKWIEANDKLAKAEQRVAEACALQVATETRFHWLDAARVAKEIRSGEWRKFVKEV